MPSNVLLNSYAVYKVNTFETANSLVDFKLFGPLYSAGKEGWPWAISLICPEIHKGLVAECPNILVSGSSICGSAGGWESTDGPDNCASADHGHNKTAPMMSRNRKTAALLNSLRGDGGQLLLKLASL